MAAPHVVLNIGAWNRYVNRVVQPYLMKKAEEIAQLARSNAPQGGTGDLRESIIVQKGDGGKVSVKVTAPHAGFVHQGTGPQHVPNPRAPYFPAVRKRGLILWAMTKGIDPFAVAHGIAAAGTPPNPFLEEAIEKVLGRFQYKWIRRDLEPK